MKKCSQEPKNANKLLKEGVDENTLKKGGKITKHFFGFYLAYICRYEILVNRLYFLCRICHKVDVFKDAQINIVPPRSSILKSHLCI
jgi:hypothetical protein